MTCDFIRYTDGTKFVMCRRSERTKRCQFCRGEAQYACDAPRPKKKSGTCDKRMCEACRILVSEDLSGAIVRTVDHCPDHPLDTQMSLL